jgi:hypothetical protein
MTPAATQREQPPPCPIKEAFHLTPQQPQEPVPDAEPAPPGHFRLRLSWCFGLVSGLGFVAVGYLSQAIVSNHGQLASTSH